MAMVEITLEIPLEVQEGLERLARAENRGRGPIDLAESLLAEALACQDCCFVACGLKRKPEPTT